MFVTASNFTLRPYLLVNLNLTGSGFTSFVDEQEAEMLRKILGSSLYNSFINGLSALPSKWAAGTYAIDDEVYYGISTWKSLQDDNTAIPVEGAFWEKLEDNLWLQLRDGGEYLYLTHRYNWPGMIAALKPFIFAEWLRANNDSVADSGVTAPKVENNDMVSPARRISKEWNIFCTTIGSSKQPINSLYGFLYGMNAVDASVFDGTFDDSFQSFISYLTITFKAPKKINMFNI